jgi:hypothetical protein
MTNHTYTWARDQVESEEEFNSLSRDHLPDLYGHQFTKMFMADDYATLDARRQVQSGVYHMRYASDTHTHDFNVTNDTAQDSYNFEMDVHMWVLFSVFMLAL